MSRQFIFPAVSVILLVPAAAQAQGSFLGKDVSTWKAELTKGDDTARRSAAFALGKIGTHAVSAVPELKKHVRNDQDARVREAAAYALGEIARDSLSLGRDANLRQVLIEALEKDMNPLVRRSAAFALGCAGGDEVSAALEKGLTDQHPAVRQNVAWALGKLNPPGVPGLRKALRDADALVKRDAAVALAGLEPLVIRPALPDLLTMCKGGDSETRRAALSVLIKAVAPGDVQAVEAIQAALEDRDEEVRIQAALALSNIGGDEAAVAVPQLVGALRQDDVELRRQAAAAFRNIGPAARKAVPDLIKSLGDPDPEVRGNAALALGGIGPAAIDAYALLLALVEKSDERPETRIEAAVALARIGDVPQAVAAVPNLLRVLADPAQDARVRERVIWALRVHNARLRELPNVYPSFGKVLNEKSRPENRMLRYDCAFMLGMLQGRDAANEVMETLHEFLKDETIQIYVSTKAVVVGSGQETNPGKLSVKETGKGDGRIMAVRALTQIGAARVGRHPGIVRELRALATSSKDPDLRGRSSDLLKEIGK